MARCKLCGQPIQWAQYPNGGSWVPLDVELTIIPEGGKAYIWRDDGSQEATKGPGRGHKIHLDTCKKSSNNMKLARLRGEQDG